MPIKVVYEKQIRLLNLDAQRLATLSLAELKQQIQKQIFDQGLQSVSFDLYYTGDFIM